METYTKHTHLQLNLIKFITDNSKLLKGKTNEEILVLFYKHENN